MKKQCLLFLAAMMVCSLANAQTNPWADITIAKSKVAPKIDGVIEDGEYLTATPIVMNNANMAHWGGKLKNETGDADLSGTFWFTWDDTYLYVAARVSDLNILNKCNQGQPLNGTDVVQFCLDPTNAKAGSVSDANTSLRIFDVAPGQKGNASAAAFWQHWPTINNADAGYPATFPNTLFASRSNFWGYEIECAIKWSEMGPNPPTPAVGKKIGYLTLLMDHDPLADPAADTLKDLWWNHTGDAGLIGDASKWNTMTLGDSINPYENYLASKVITPPAIDGVIDRNEWRTAAIPINHAAMSAFGGNYLDTEDASVTDANHSAIYYMEWDANNLYFAAHVTDDQINNVLAGGGGLNATDVVQLCLDPNYTRTTSIQDRNCGVAIFDVTPGLKDNPSTPGFWQHWPDDGSSPRHPYPNVRFASSTVSGGYEVEVAIPWGDMAPNPPTPTVGMKMGYLGLLMDYDSNARKQFEWNSTLTAADIGNASKYRTMALGPVAELVTLVPVEMSNFSAE